jgi:uncharacterized surface protein with fasciclin (FAS1) repeats
MYNTFTKFKFSTIAAVAATSLLLAGTAFAGPPAGKFKPGKPGGANIVMTAVAISQMMNDEQGDPQFSYLLGAVGCLSDAEAEIVLGLLTGEDNYTLFAPVNKAFRDLQTALGVAEEDLAPEATCAVDAIFEPGTLFTVLAYHVTEGRRFTNSVFNKNQPKEIEMVAAGYITTTPSLTIIDGVPQVINPVIANVKASNGVIHAIGTVMLPFNPF